ncbi:hypothetical protein NKDENANG_03365 [Candidatus Entotheonellaceae bacterium PAL068K]
MAYRWICPELEQAGKREEDFEMQVWTVVRITDDIKAGLDRLKPG